MPSNLRHRAFVRLIAIEISMTCIAILIICVIYSIIHFYCKNSFQPNVFHLFALLEQIFFSCLIPFFFYENYTTSSILGERSCSHISLLIFFFQKFAKINMRIVEIGKRRVIAQTNINIGWLKIANHRVINVLVSLKRK